MIFAKSKKLLREVKWFGRGMSLHSRYCISWSGRPSAYLPGFRSGIHFGLLSFVWVLFTARFIIFLLNAAPPDERPRILHTQTRSAWGALPTPWLQNRARSLSFPSTPSNSLNAKKGTKPQHMTTHS